ncbi:MAG: methyl-accepting chemotaxis protein, partial [Pseudomonadota bacterium]|nr:methyl-accepting chemotaxis protein [Pseudomonadota bacterium]
MHLKFGQKLLIAFGSLFLLVMAPFAFYNDLRLQSTAETYVDALLDETVQQNTSSLAEWLNTRLV